MKQNTRCLSFMAALFLTACAFLAGPLHGESGDPPELIGDRPDFTERAAVVPAGSLQIEGGYTFSRERDSYNHSIGEFLFRVGLLDWLELRLAANSLVVRDRYGNTDTGKDEPVAGFKISLLTGADHFVLWQPSIAIVGETTIPVGSDGFIENQFQPCAKLALSWVLTERLGLGFNVNYTRASDGGDYYDEFSFSSSLGVSITERVGMFFEYYLFYPNGDGGHDAHYADGGFTFLLSTRCRLT